MGFQTINHTADLCIVGGGLAGLCAAVAGARYGLKVVLMHDRPMLGGNASSEIRMWVCGAQGDNNRETGLLEEIMMENQYRNPDKNYYIWDGILYGLAKREKNITLLLNCSCLDASMKDGSIAAVTGWQTTTQRYHRVEAALFADCSGDSILAPLTGASFREGREARKEFGESIQPEQPDTCTMGMSCMFQAEETEKPQTFIAPEWAEKITEDKLVRRKADLKDPLENFWYLELGGMRDTIGDTEEIRDELIPLAYGIWDYLKNSPQEQENSRNWRLTWIGSLPGKRESRRYQGPYIMNQNDVRSGGNFSDEVAYGGWSMDDHHPAGFRTREEPTIYHEAPSPYGIPYRCLYSRDIPNLFFAGRNISVSHAVLSSCRVMGTCALLGQAVGTAAYIAVAERCLPKDISEKYVVRLQNLLMDDDCYLPHFRRPVSALCRNALLTGDGERLECLRDGVDRDRIGEAHAWVGRIGHRITYTFDRPCHIKRIRFVFDSDLNRSTLPYPENKMNRNMFHNRHLSYAPSYVPKTMLKRYRVAALCLNGDRQIIVDEANNYIRLRKYDTDISDCTEIIFEPLETWGSDVVRIFSFEADGDSGEGD
nr:FAD-dependent oxidoreductase [uncultured Acetatifactor sp.]